MSCLEELNESACPKIDPAKIDAYFKLFLDEEDDSILNLDTSWGLTCVDLTPAVKAGETITHLFLSPEDKPTALQYNREDYGREGAENDGVDCIEGDDLSRIISMTKLKDVSQTIQIKTGDVYMWNGTEFVPFDLQTFVDTTNKRLTNLEKRMDTVETQIVSINNQIAEINNHLARIDAILERPSGIPQDVRLVWGKDINLYSDYTNSNNRQHGFFTHSISTEVNNDLYFS